MKRLLTIIVVIFCFFTNFLNVYGEEIEYVSDYVYLYDLDNKQVLIDKGSNEKIYPASMTKMMTLIVAIENISNPEETITITDEMLRGLNEANASQAGFKVGDEPRLLDLMYGVNLPSGADCTNALAYYVSGNLENYVELMNNKAKEIGMTNTNFKNVTGLHDDNHYSTLQDIAKLMEYGLKNELWSTIFKSKTHISIPINSNPNGIEMVSTVFKYINNDSKLKYNVSIDGFLGAKSGYTNQARYCLASIAEKDGVRYALISAHAWISREIPSHVLDAEIIYNYYYNNFHKKVFYNENDVILEIPVNFNFNHKKVEIKATEEIKRIVNNSSNVKVVIDSEKSINAPISVDDVIGTLKILENDNIIYETSLYPSEDIEKQFIAYILTVLFWFVINNKMKIFAFIIIMILLVSLMKIIVNKSKK